MTFLHSLQRNLLNWSLVCSSLNKDMIRWAHVICLTNHRVHMPALCWNQTCQQSLISHTLHFSYLRSWQRVNKGSRAKTKFGFTEHTSLHSTPQMHPANFPQDKANKKFTVLFTPSKKSYGRLNVANMSRKIKLLFIITISPSGTTLLLGITLHAKPALWWWNTYHLVNCLAWW